MVILDRFFFHLGTKKGVTGCVRQVVILCMNMVWELSWRNHGVIQSVYEIGNHFWACENWCRNSDKLTENKVFSKPLISKHKSNHKLHPMYIKHCKLVF